MMREIRVHLADPEFVARECPVKFTLTYEGQLNTNGSKSDRKHRMRRHFRSQLERLWRVDPLLSNWLIPAGDGRNFLPAQEWISGQMPTLGAYNFIPLVTKGLAVECALDFKVLRPTDKPGSVSDIDNQLKQLVDALKMPGEMGELGNNSIPQDGENPFYVLVQDDRLITKISSTNDELLQPICGKDDIGSSDVRIFIDVHIRPMMPNANNIIFYSDDSRVWDHKYDETILGNLTELSPSQLKSATTQCIYRVMALDETFSSDRSMSTHARYTRYEERETVWKQNLWPSARALHHELQRRIYGQPPFPRNFRTVALESGSLAGATPLSDVIVELDSLVRQL